jgi:hypothetical protein
MRKAVRIVIIALIFTLVILLEFFGLLYKPIIDWLCVPALTVCFVVFAFMTRGKLGAGRFLFAAIIGVWLFRTLIFGFITVGMPIWVALYGVALAIGFAILLCALAWRIRASQELRRSS